MNRVQLRERSRARSSADLRSVEVTAQGPLPLLTQLQAVLGNRAADQIRAGEAGSADELYLLDLARAAAETGHDLQHYLPWRASPAWNDFVRGWYRVLWAERERDTGERSGAPDVNGQVGGSDATPAVDGVAENGASLTEDMGATAEATVDGAGPSGASSAVAAARSGAPAFDDPVAMDDWFARVRASTGAGRPLDAQERAFLEEVFGRPAPDARVHEGSASRQAALDINARAFTIGDEIWFGEAPDLSTPAGAELLAHEITHVIQNSLGKGAQQRAAVSSPGQPLEIEAERYGREARRAQSAWKVEPPGAVDGAGRYLVAQIEQQLPSEVRGAPPALTLEAVRTLLAGRASAWVAEQGARLDGQVDGPRAATALSRSLLDDVRAAINAPATPELLGLLARVAGGPTSAEVESFAAIYAPYPDLAAQMSVVLSGLGAPTLDPGADAARFGAAIDADADHAALTRQLVTQLVASLHLPAGSVNVHTDTAAAERAGAHGARGLAEGADIYLDPAQFDPSTGDGRALLAHEVVHVAQAELPAFDGARAGAFAEAEAHLAADRFAGGAAIQPLEMGLPDGHVAAEGDVSAADLQALLAQYKTMNESRGAGFVTPPGSSSKPKADGTEDHQKKIDQYAEGVDGIADLIGDLDAFDELCDAVDDKDESKAKTALNQVRSSEPYAQLCQMWQGAKEGKADEATLKAKFEAEFHNRGFWGSTEEAFRRVRDAAKKDAKPAAEAGKAKADMNEASGKGTPMEGTTEKDQKDGNNGQANSKGTGVAGGNADLAALAAAKVDEKAPDLAAFNAMGQANDDLVAQAVFERNHQMGLSAEVASGATEYGRTNQILSELGKGFTGSFIKGFTDQALDTLVLDTLGNLADKGLSLAFKGTFKTPFVGPLIGLVMNNPFGADYQTGLFGTEPGKEGKFVKGWQSFKGAFDWSQFEGQTGWDWVGVLCMKLADFFGGLRDILDGLATLCGTLSALSYVAGGLFIGIGLALVWLAGVGAPLISIGGWLVRAGGILARINTALGLVVLALSALTLVFRTAAAFLVPAELYAQQLAGVGDAASNYGEKVGAKVADNTANALKEKAGNAYDARKQKADAKEGDGEAAGRTDGKKAVDDVRKNNDELEAQKKEFDKLSEDAKKEQDAKKADEDAKKKQGDEGGPDAKQKSFVRKMFADVFSPMKGLKEFGAGLREMGGLIVKPRTAAAEGAQATHEALDDALKKRMAKAKESATELESTLNKLNENAAKFKDDPEMSAQYKKVIDETEAELKKVQKDLDEWDREYARYRSDVAKSKNAEANETKKKSDEHEDADAAKKALDEKKKELKSLQEEKKKLEKAVKEDQEALSDARAKQKTANEEAEAGKTKLDREKEHLEGFKKANEAKTEAERLRREKSALEKEVKRLQAEADAIETKQKLEKELQALGEKKEFESKFNDLRMSTLEQYVGRRVEVKDSNGTFKGEITKVEIDGVTVNGPNGPQKVPYGQIGDRYIRTTGQKIAQAKTEIDAMEAKYRDIGLDLQYNHDKTAPGDPQVLRNAAVDKQKQADNLAPQLELAKQNSTYNGSKQTEQTHKDRALELENQSAGLNRDATNAGNEVKRLETQLAGHQKDKTARETAITDAEAKIEELRKSQDLKNQHNYGVAKGHLRGASSGNATGGVGSSWKDLFNGVWAAISKAREAQRLKTEGKPVPENLEAPTTSAGDWLQKATGLKASSEEEAKKIGQKQAMLEELFNLTLSVDILAMMEAREKATEAAQVHADKHAWAYACYHAELQVDGLAKETETLAKEGKPVQEVSKKQLEPILKAKSDEDQRKQALQGGNGDIQKPDSALTGIVVELVQALAKHGDRFDDKPNVGDPNAGQTITNAQNDASKQGKDQKKASTGASDEQRALLDKAIALRAAQEGKLGSDISSAEGKHQEELAIKSEIQQLKAKALSERDAAGQEAETHAGKFNSDYKALTEWSRAYKAKRQELSK